jgi:peptidyl-prolyl cis-trans isomerase C
MMKATKLILFLLLPWAVAGMNPAFAADAPKSTGGKVATVNGVDISRSEYDREVKLYTDRMARRGQPLDEQQVKIIGGQILDRMIETELLYQESRKQGVRVQPEEIETQFSEIKQRFSSEQEFTAAIEQMDITEAGIRAQIERGLAINELVKTRIADKIEISEKESRTFYDQHPELFSQPEQVKASHILIKVAPDADADKKTAAGKKIEQIQARLKKGEDFAALARENSEGPSAPKGGDLGYFKRGTMVKPFEDAAFALDVNQVSGRVETMFGYHLIKVFDKKPEQTLVYAEVKGELANHLKQQKVKQEVDTYLEDLKKNAKIEKSI